MWFDKSTKLMCLNPTQGEVYLHNIYKLSFHASVTVTGWLMSFRETFLRFETDQWNSIEFIRRVVSRIVLCIDQYRDDIVRMRGIAKSRHGLSMHRQWYCPAGRERLRSTRPTEGWSIPPASPQRYWGSLLSSEVGHNIDTNRWFKYIHFWKKSIHRKI
jgi:hypothetical protein